MLQTLTSSQLSEWEAYDRVDPIGSWRQEFMMANFMSYLDNVIHKLYGKKGTSVRQSTAKDFLPRWNVDPNEPYQFSEIEQPQENLVSKLISWAKGHNKRVEKEETKPNNKKRR